MQDCSWGNLWAFAVRLRQKEKNGSLAVHKPLPSEYAGLEEMYANIKCHSKTAVKWLDYYCCSPSQKNIKLLVDNLQELLSQKYMIKIQMEKEYSDRIE